MSANFDVEGYASQFARHGKIRRLLHVADRSTGDCQVEAFKLALEELKQGENTALYEEAVKAAHEKGHKNFHVDKDWVIARDAKAVEREAALEHELKSSKTNLITQHIRFSFQAMGDFMYARGNLPEALKNYARTKDYCSQASDVLSSCLTTIKVSLEMKNSANVNNYVLMAEQTPDYKEQKIACAKLYAAHGLAHLQARQYKKAALRFTQVTGGATFSWKEVISPQEIALYGVLCSLAEFTRAELKEHVIDNIAFREFLDNFAAARELVNDFYNSKYTAVLATLNQLNVRLELDINLDSHKEILCKAVRSKALVQYTAPYTAISLPKMAAAFSTDQRGLEAELVKLIQVGDIPARIDSGSQVLFRRTPDVRAKAHRAVLASGEEYLRTTKAMLTRASLLRYNLTQRASPGGRARRESGVRQGPPGPLNQGADINMGCLDEADELSADGDGDMVDDLIDDDDDQMMAIS